MQGMGKVQLEVQSDRCIFERADAGFEFKNRLQAIEHQGQSMKELLTHIDNILCTLVLESRPSVWRKHED